MATKTREEHEAHMKQAMRILRKGGAKKAKFKEVSSISGVPYSTLKNAEKRGKFNLEGKLVKLDVKLTNYLVSFKPKVKNTKRVIHGAAGSILAVNKITIEASDTTESQEGPKLTTTDMIDDIMNDINTFSVSIFSKLRSLVDMMAEDSDKLKQITELLRPNE